MSPVPVSVPIIHRQEGDSLLDDLLHTTLDFNRVVAEMILVHVSDHQHALDAVGTRDRLDFVVLVGFDLGLDVEIALGEIPADVV